MNVDDVGIQVYSSRKKNTQNANHTTRLRIYVKETSYMLEQGVTGA